MQFQNLLRILTFLNLNRPSPAEPETTEEENNSDDSEEGFLGMSQENETPDPQPKPDPAAEHKAKQDERLAQISEIEKRTITLRAIRKLSNKTRRILDGLLHESEIFNFEEYNRWSDSWTKLEYPLPPDQDEESH